MKVTIDAKESFRPVSITFTIESAAEGNAFYGLFDYYKVTEFLDRYMGADFCREVREGLGSCGINDNDSNIWASFLGAVNDPDEP